MITIGVDVLVVQDDIKNKGMRNCMNIVIGLSNANKTQSSLNS